jgi:uncharacterized protein
MMLLIDFLIYALPGLALAIWAQTLIWRTRAEALRVPAAKGYSGAEAAAMVMAAADISDVRIEPAAGEPGDHFDPRRKVLYLSEGTYAGRSVASVLAAVHEAGHAIQQQAGYRGLIVRNFIVPLAVLGSIGCWILILSGFLIGMTQFVMYGVLLFSLILLLQLVNLPIEFDASRRGREILEATGGPIASEKAVVDKMLFATAWTHVAVTLTGLFAFIYSLFRSCWRGKFPQTR